ncbi:mechanosensitive ion channel [Roseiconus nitratireducens]|uniref:Mechanosensitive ion channel n=1 Tax=Roseiconus nitratireducens TaxID=2605748 RepID=A0A5M6D7J3_9BACT|nr:mechanosensitive ion channel family protein [Roseiconus nitratireducens]KAA5542626.1 mechanosensitive ion channel [Roseiconus nitratireducens]
MTILSSRWVCLAFGLALSIGTASLVRPTTVSAQEKGALVEPPSAAESDTEAAPNVAQKVEINPNTSDPQIANRLSEIFQATGWYDDLDIHVDRGVVFLEGVADTAAHREWAEATAMKTTDVVAAVNKIRVAEQPLWNFAPALESMRQLRAETIRILPLVLVGMVIVVLSYFVARLAARATRSLANRRVDNKLLRQVTGNVVGVLIFIVGAYIALRVSGLTRLAVTLLGGTGLVGLALGFAFRDIAENYLASILISLNQPFRVGDLIEVDGSQGFVRKVTTRGTILNTLEGNQIQIPNSTVYKNKVLNYTATPLMRLSFKVGIGYEDSVADVQELIMDVFRKHVAVTEDPAPLVLVDSLGSATVNLVCYFWFDRSQHSPLKVGSSVIRTVKQVLMASGVSMPDEARELVFPDGVPVRMLEASTETKPVPQPPRPSSFPREESVSEGEGDLSNEQAEVMKVTEDDQTVAGKENLIE